MAHQHQSQRPEYTTEQTRAILAIVAPGGLGSSEAISEACHALATLAAQLYVAGTGLDPSSPFGGELALRMARDGVRAMLDSADRNLRDALAGLN